MHFFICYSKAKAKAIKINSFKILIKYRTKSYFFGSFR